mmetsp:Transcript_18535/g.30231  ORF Transcript_18535/g.30231 Transcript_18535/m.30231 type:complete len:312 (+) Transcript_18535:69-1004(+)
MYSPRESRDEDLLRDELLADLSDDLYFKDAELIKLQKEEEADENNSGLSVEEKKKRKEQRLERNREIARNCRKRKRERIEGIMQEVTSLREANRQLELKLKMCQNKLGEATSGRGNRGKDDEDKRLKEIRSMSKMLEQKCTDEEILKRLRGYTETYSDFGDERNKLVKVHINQLEQLLLPTQISKMLLWLLKQDEEFYEDSNPDSIWNMLCKELKLDEQQKAQVMEQRSQLGAQNASMKKCLVSLNKFEEEVQKNMLIRRKQVHKVTKIISPTQTIKFLQWVENNQACIHMLNGLWSVNKQRQQQITKDMM